mgnify:CR=1 FL=1
MPHLVRRFFVLGLLAAAACAGTPACAQDAALQIKSSSLPFKIDEPQATTVSKLKWRGGISMTANAKNFGGWSDLYVAPDGKTLISVSDEGSWFTAGIDYDVAGNLVGLTGRAIGLLRGLDGKPLPDKAWADSEGMAPMPDGSWIVSFERHHRIWRYPTLDATPTAIEPPADFEQQPNNGGVEALVALKDGSIIAISEEMTLVWADKQPLADGVKKVQERAEDLRTALRELFGIAPEIACVIRSSLLYVRDPPQTLLQASQSDSAWRTPQMLRKPVAFAPSR